MPTAATLTATRDFESVRAQCLTDIVNRLGTDLVKNEKLKVETTLSFFHNNLVSVSFLAVPELALYLALGSAV